MTDLRQDPAENPVDDVVDQVDELEDLEPAADQSADVRGGGIQENHNETLVCDAS